jgi:hypothetical protein
MRDHEGKNVPIFESLCAPLLPHVFWIMIATQQNQNRFRLVTDRPNLLGLVFGYDPTPRTLNSGLTNSPAVLASTVALANHLSSR